MRIALAVLFALATAVFGLAERPQVQGLGSLAVLAAFVLAWVRFAVDLVELRPVDLAADLAAIVAALLVFLRVPSGSVAVNAVLAAAALAAQLTALAARRRRRVRPA